MKCTHCGTALDGSKYISIQGNAYCDTEGRRQDLAGTQTPHTIHSQDEPDRIMFFKAPPR